jgi:hypothetical protein
VQIGWKEDPPRTGYGLIRYYRDYRICSGSIADVLGPPK